MRLSGCPPTHLFLIQDLTWLTWNSCATQPTPCLLQFFCLSVCSCGAAPSSPPLRTFSLNGHSLFGGGSFTLSKVRLSLVETRHLFLGMLSCGWPEAGAGSIWWGLRAGASGSLPSWTLYSAAIALKPASISGAKMMAAFTRSSRSNTGYPQTQEQKQGGTLLQPLSIRPGFPQNLPAGVTPGCLWGAARHMVSTQRMCL